MRLNLCLVFILLVSSIISVTSGASFDIDQITVIGSENGSAEEMIQVSARISFDSTGEVTFPGGDTLHLSTDLMNSEWQYSLIVDHFPVQTFRKESSDVFINGYFLEYSQGRSEYLSVNVSGMLPDEMQSGMIHGMTVTQYDEYGIVRGDGVKAIPVFFDTNDESVPPENNQSPALAAPAVTQSPLNGSVALMAILSALAVIYVKEKGD